ncbi:endonuclease domain-containing protein [Sphingomonas sp. S1-29]|uniref:endonuclease domain-containing protein n=1 Tax=Sphingomonas sp. S1-29 TaxID=2991074 RepID=UPI00223FD9B5|nr:endonuclease domain-containing protein [Sphingomonas sp. S1-29]UZK68172.1 endonuclease domain-containing protein [Sphingomonas sp. S1-29]
MPKTDDVLLQRARQMRTQQTPIEQKIWLYLRGKRFAGVKFSRQVVIGPYIADFVARSQKLVIEVDGDSHATDTRRDEKRTAFLQAQGYRVVRFDNRAVGKNLAGVLQAIAEALDGQPLSQPSPRGGEGF